MVAISEIRPESAFAVARGKFRSNTFTGVSSVPTTFELSTNSFRRSIQRIEQFRTLPHPAAHCLIRDLHAEAAEDLRLPVHRQVIGNFADDHLRQQRRARQVLFSMGFAGFIAVGFYE